MRLLVVTQAVDDGDPVLAFFARWIAELAKHMERVEVVCLKEGKHDLPANVHVHSLGKEHGRPSFGRAAYALRFLRLAWRLRDSYDTVFVHMNQEYLLIASWLWMLLRKPAYLWRNHLKGNWLTNVAVGLSRRVFATSSAAYTARFAKTRLMPIGIDTERFSPGSTPPLPHSVLFLGRLDPVKRVLEFVTALTQLARGSVSFQAEVIGDPTPGSDAGYAKQVETLGAPLVARGMLKFQPGIPNAETPNAYRTHDVYVNLTPSGSFDKTIGEAMACGALVVCANEAVRAIVPQGCMTDGSPDDTSRAIGAALAFSLEERAAVTARQREFIEREHSLAELVKRLLPQLAS